MLNVFGNISFGFLRPISYAISLVTSGLANKIFLAGYDGYNQGDIRNQEIEELIEKFINANPSGL